MSDAFVVDRSVAEAWFQAERSSAYTEEALGATVDGRVWAAAGWPLQLIDWMLEAQRRRAIDASRMVRWVQAAAGLRVEIDAEPAQLAEVAGLATRHRLPAGDAATLLLAQRRKLPLASIDERVRAAARHEGVALAQLGANDAALAPDPLLAA